MEVVQHPAIGIDLGTSNSVIAYLSSGAGAADVVAAGTQQAADVLDVPQLISASSVGERNSLPSALYIPYAQEFAAGGPTLPWSGDSQLEEVVGVLARDRAQLTPERVITSAKSWLCNTQVDRKADILPWKAEGIERRYSPFEATRRYLIHLYQTLRLQLEKRGERWYDDEGKPREIVLTVPASFDEVARQLTLEAAQHAGFERVVLLEEPQAAFYSWISGAQSSGAQISGERAESDDWRSQVKAGDVVLVCDVGGGTADFTLIAIRETAGELALERVSVGDHILLGGDNMDLALAFRLRQDLEASGQKLDTWQFRSLIHGARDAKERLLAAGLLAAGAADSEPETDSVRVGIASRSANLFAEALSATVTSANVREVIVEGFFPLVESDARPRERTMVGLQELGLRYAHDAAITKHLAKFLSESYQTLAAHPELAESCAGCLHHERRLAVPTAVLFNGGVFKSGAIRSRVLEQLQTWGQERPTRELIGQDLDLAVAQGAAYYARVRNSGKGVRIRSGLSHSYYLGLESSEPAIPGYEPPLKGVCVATQGMEEGTSAELSAQSFGLLTNEPVQFRFFSSPRRPLDRAGALLDNISSLAEETAVVETTLSTEGLGTEGSGTEGSGTGRSGTREIVPVYLTSEVTEVGTLGLFLQQVDPSASQASSGRRWRLEFNVRGERS